MLATLVESICSLGVSNKIANTNQSANNATKPATKDFHGFCGMASETINEQKTKLNQGNLVYKPIAKLSSAVNKIEAINFINKF